ncbi:hypothetical protein GOODEAATRI_028473, partial [Goodea atripinnis]
LYLKRFGEFHTSTQATPKMIEAAKSRVSRVKAFLHYMSEGQQKISDWTFLHNVERIKKWVSEMGQSGKEITTLRFYIHHAFQFVEYMVKSRPQQCRLTQEQMKEILLYLEKARRPIMAHQSRVKRAKMARIPESASILKCLQLAPERVEKLLGRLFTPFFSHFLTYMHACPRVMALSHEDLSLLSIRRAGGGHLPHGRPGGQKCTLLTLLSPLWQVADHKTTLQFREASLVLTRAEFSWIKQLHNIKEKLDSSNPYVLFTLGQQPFKNINRYLRMAWRKMDLKGDINFTLIRTALADCVSIAELSLLAYILR